MRTIFFTLFLSLTAVVSAQDPADIFHKTFDLDSVDQVSFSIYDNDLYEVKYWPGDDILVETSVVLNNGEPHILKFFLKNQRWELQATINGATMVLESMDTNRRFVKGTEGTTSETVDIVIYMPENFKESGGTWSRSK